MEKASSGTRSRVARAPGDITLAALLAAGAAAERARVPRSGWVAAVPIIIVNYVAFRAQLRFWQAHLGHADAFLVSVALESVAVYWSWLAAQALIADDSALRPRLAAYGTALLIGVLNYSHYMRFGWRPTVAAVTFGLMSAISPWLWSAYSRRVSRPLLKARGLVEDHAVRLGVTRWFWHAYRCTGVMWLATWDGVSRPAEAIALYEARQAGKKAAREKEHDTVSSPAPDSPAGNASPSARLRREPRRVVTEQREARTEGNGLAAASPREQAVLDEAQREARREAGRKGAAIRWAKGRDPEAVPAGVNGDGSHGS